MKIYQSIKYALPLVALACNLAHAAGKSDQEAEMKAAMDAARTVAKTGPAEIPLKNQGTMKLPAGYVFIPQPQAGQVLKAMGNGDDPSRLGLIFPGGDSQWMVVPRYIDAGYVKDDEARDWKSKEMLEGMKAGAEETNKERAARGIPEMEIIGWVQQPQYDAASHRLVWSIESKDKGAPAGENNGINYNTFVLGREGYISMNLVTSKNSLEQDKPAAAELLAATSFNDGKKYSDFNSSTDKVAEYGIAALVGGIAAKKLGLFAVIAAFVAKFFKVIAIAAFGGLAALGKLFKGKKDEAA